MQFILVPDWSAAIKAVRSRLISELEQSKRVLWLISGGSQIAANTEIMDGIDTKLSENLTISLVDERYGEVGHPDSNWTKLVESGFNPKHAKTIPVLMKNLELRLIRERYEHKIRVALADNDFILGQLGIGSDGHTAGILPHSPATDETDKYTIYYESDPYNRLSLTFFSLRKLSAAYALCFGEEKRTALENLASQRQISLDDQPAQILKEISESYIYNDQVSGTV